MTCASALRTQLQGGRFRLHGVNGQGSDDIGIDVVHLIKPRCVVANIQNSTIFILQPNRNKETMMKFMSSQDGHKQALGIFDSSPPPECPSSMIGEAA